MGLFKDFLEGVANGVVSAASDGRMFAASQGGQGQQVIQACCSQLGWSIDERVGTTGIILHFRDPIVNIRKLLVTVGEAGRIAVLSVFSAAQLTQQQLAPEVLGYLLRRNGEMTFPAWQLLTSGNATFALTYGVLLAGLDAPTFKVLCETMCKEAHDFDAKLRQAGVL